MPSRLAELALDRAPLTRRADLEQAVGLVEAATTSLAKATSCLLDASTDDVLAASTPYLDLASLAVTRALMARQVRWAEQHASPAEASVAAARFAFFAAARVDAPAALLQATTSAALRRPSHPLPCNHPPSDY